MDTREREHLEPPEEERGTAEQLLLEHSTPHGGTLPPHLLTNRPFLWLVLGEGVAALAFWAFLGGSFAEATFRFHAGPSQLFLLTFWFALPFMLLTPVQGVIVDRWSPKWMNVIGYLLFLAAIPVAWSAHSIHSIYVATLLIGFGDATIQPARSALIGLLVDEDRLVSANGMTTMALQVALVVGALSASYVIHVSGVETVYAGALVASLLSFPLFVMVPDRRAQGEGPAMRLRDLGDGARTSWRVPELRTLMFLGLVMFLVIGVFFALEPFFVKNTLHRLGDSLLALWASHGLGALIGAFLLTRAADGARRELRFIGTGLAVAGFGLMLYASVASFPVALAGTAFMGAGFSFFFAPGLALIQRVSGEDKRGRVTSVFGVLQEAMEVLVSATFAFAVAIGPDLVRPALLATGVIMAGAGFFGIQAFRQKARGSDGSASG